MKGLESFTSMGGGTVVNFGGKLLTSVENIENVCTILYLINIGRVRVASSFLLDFYSRRV